MDLFSGYFDHRPDPFPSRFSFAQLIREFLPRKTFFDDLRALTRYLCFDNWEALMTFM